MRRLAILRAAPAPVGWIAALAALFSVLNAAPAARASCVPPLLELLWTYPEDGATDVPVNAVFWLLNSSWGARPSATLNGAELEVVGVTFGASKIEPGELEPNTEYVLELEYPRTAANAGEPTSSRISFRTGSARAARRPAPDVRRVAARGALPVDTAQCRKVLDAQDCFDTGQNVLLAFEVEDEEAIAWFVLDDYQGESALWPVACGEPTLLVHAPLGQGCKEVSAIGPGGVIGTAVQACPAPAGSGGEGGEPEPNQRDGGASGGAGAGAGGAGAGAAGQARDGGPRTSDAGATAGPRDDSGGCSTGGAMRQDASGLWLAGAALLGLRLRAARRVASRRART